MAIPSAAQTAVSAGWQQVRVQQAQRNAAQAEQQARLLESQAQAAHGEASRAQENARNMQVQSDQAWDNAGRARQGVAAMRSAAVMGEELVGRLKGVAERIGTSENGDSVHAAETPPAALSGALSSKPVAASLVAPRPVINIDGQETGKLISVRA